MPVSLKIRTTPQLGMGLATFAVLAGASLVMAQEPLRLSGGWTATVGTTRTMRGRWVGQMLPGDPNSAHGSWTLTSESGKTVMTGTWSARKTARGWQGTWSAQERGGRSAGGTWRAALPTASKGTLQSALELTLQEEITGTWQSGRLTGSWWLRGKIPVPSP